MSHIRLEQVSKIYNVNSTQAQSALALLAQGMDSKAVKLQTGYSVGLYDINLAIETGELHCIMGLSGSGKSTLIRHLNRLIDPTSGKIWVDTAISSKTPSQTVSSAHTSINILELDDKGLQQYRQNNVSMVFQHFGLMPHMTVIQNVAYGLKVRKMSVSERHEIARHWLNEVGLPNLENSYPDELSGGMRQRVMIAIALSCSPKLLIADEPTTALDVTI